MIRITKGIIILILASLLINIPVLAIQTEKSENSTQLGLKPDGITDNSLVLVNWLNSLDSNPTTLFFPPGTYRISNSISIPPKVQLEFAYGAKLAVDEGKIVAIDGEIKAGLSQIFSGPGTISGNPKIDEVFPEWWGAIGDEMNDDSPAFQKAFDFVAENYKTIKVSKRHYLWSTTINTPSRFSLHGCNDGNTVGSKVTATNECTIKCTANPVFEGSTPGILSAPFICQATIKNMSFYTTKPGITFFKLFNLRMAEIEHSFFRNFDYIIYGKITNMTKIYNNNFLNIGSSLLSDWDLSGSARESGDSDISNNYINGSTDSTHTYLLNIYYPNLLTISDNYFDFAVRGINASSGESVLIHDNHFDYCYQAIYGRDISAWSINGNSFIHGNKVNSSKWTSPNMDMTTNDWNGIYLGDQCGDITIIGNMGCNQEVLINISGAGHRNIRTYGNIIKKLNGKLFDLNYVSDSDYLYDGEGLIFSEID